VFDELAALHDQDPQVAEVVTKKIVLDFSIEEIAGLLEVPKNVVEADLRFGRAWLKDRRKHWERGHR
jgi:DNA-directed RNA polymerase specialized sigma24 family protein